MQTILTHLRTTPPPTPPPPSVPSTSQAHSPLPPSIPTPAALPLHPTTYLAHALDALSPSIRLRTQRGLVGGGASVQVPAPLTLRQRRRTAVMWVLEQVEKRKGAPGGFARRFAEEVVAVVEGRSACWERRRGVARGGVAGRVHLGVAGRPGGVRGAGR